MEIFLIVSGNIFYNVLCALLHKSSMNQYPNKEYPKNKHPDLQLVFHKNKNHQSGPGLQI